MLSVVIVNWNTREHLRACLHSLGSSIESIEIIVVDNASADGSADMVKRDFAHVKLIANHANLGYAAANNQGFEIATGSFILTLNPDTEVAINTLATAHKKILGNPELGVVAGRLEHPDGSTQRSVRGWPSLLGILGDLTGLAKLFPTSAFGSYRLLAFDYSKEQLAPQPMGTFLLFRRAALDSIGTAQSPFDPQFPIFFNDVDLLYRLKNAGWPCLYCPDVRVVHHGGESTRQVKKSMIWESHRSLARYLKKHYRTPVNALGLELISSLLSISAFIRAKGYDVGFSN